MIFALLPGLDETAAVDRAMAMPDPGQIVHEAAIDADKKGYVGSDQVVYSVILGSDVGDWSFNMIGLVEAVTGNLIAVSTMPETPKRATDLATNTTGNIITRNFVLSFVDAQNLTGINVSAETWQFDYLAELNAHADCTDNPHNVTTAQIGAETPAGAQARVNALGYSAADVLAKLLTVDGEGSGLDGDLVRGLPADFSSNLSVNGWQKLPSGIIIQWGVGPLATTEGTAYPLVALPVAFPNAIVHTMVSTHTSSSNIYADQIFEVVPSPSPLTHMKFFPQWFGTGTQGLVRPAFLAIGY